jgi:fatty-acyl-CoA synthase
MSRVTLVEALTSSAKSKAGYIYLEETGEERFQPFQELLRESQKIAGMLAERGLKKGDRVAIIVPESQAFLESFFGASVGGFIPVPLYPPMNLGQLDSYLDHAKHIIRASQAKLILTTNQVRRVLGTVQAECPLVRTVLPFEEAKSNHAGFIEKVSLDDVGFIQFTSGSTSRPKGVVLTHDNLVSNVSAIVKGLDVQDADLGVSWLPLFHDMGLIGMAMASLYTAHTTLLMSPILFLKRPVEWLRAITRHKGSVSFAPNFAYGLCTKRVKESDIPSLDLSSWRVAGCGAEPIQAATLMEFAKKFEPAGFKDNAFLPCYGMAEHTLAITFPKVGSKLKVDAVNAKSLAEHRRAEISEGDPNTVNFVNCGHTFDGHELRIVDENDNPVGERIVGEIVLRGPSVMRGYDQQQDLTKTTMRGGWLHTGDLGYIVDGELYVCGRNKDMIILNGRNYYPQDLEWSLNDIPGVRKGNVVAFGTSAFSGKEKVVMVVEAKGVNEVEFTDKIKRKVQEAHGVMLDDVKIVPPGTLPKTSSGKLQRARTKARYEAGDLTAPSSGSIKLKLVGHLVASQMGYLKAFVNRVVDRSNPPK